MWSCICNDNLNVHVIKWIMKLVFWICNMCLVLQVRTFLPKSKLWNFEIEWSWFLEYELDLEWSWTAFDRPFEWNTLKNDLQIQLFHDADQYDPKVSWTNDVIWNLWIQWYYLKNAIVNEWLWWMIWACEYADEMSHKPYER